MKNLAGVKDCDKTIIKEITEEGLEFYKFPDAMNSEVESRYIAYMNGWKFVRAWRYWIATSNKTVLLFKYAEKLHEQHGNVVRVQGHCGCPTPREFLKEPWQLGVNMYHVDTQEGLNALTEIIKKQKE